MTNQGSPIEGLGRILASAIEGAIFAILNFIMVTYMDAFSSLSVADSASVTQTLEQIAISWALIYFFAAYLFPVFLAYGTMGGGLAGWGGVLIYTIAWVFVASLVPIIGAGLPLHFIAVLILAVIVGIPFYLRERNRGAAPRGGLR